MRERSGAATCLRKVSQRARRRQRQGTHQGGACERAEAHHVQHDEVGVVANRDKGRGCRLDEEAGT